VNVSEHEMMSAQDPHDSDACEWPVWEVQGHGTVTAAGDPRDGAVPHEVLPPWVDIRLTFADGARIDVLAVVRDGQIAIEDAQADPPLALDGLATMAEMIGAPLQNACQVVVGQRVSPQPRPGAAEEPKRPAPERETEPRPQSVARLAADGEPGAEPEADPGSEAAPETEPVPVPEIAPATETAPVPETASAPAPESEPATGSGEWREELTGRHRAPTSAPRGAAARRSVAEIYRAARSAGRDPVLAVMSATGFGRRKALRLIAGARDRGYLTPRHHRR
jgi:hypothetical protein